MATAADEKPSVRNRPLAGETATCNLSGQDVYLLQRGLPPAAAGFWFATPWDPLPSSFRQRLSTTTIHDPIPIDSIDDGAPYIPRHSAGTTPFWAAADIQPKQRRSPLRWCPRGRSFVAFVRGCDAARAKGVARNESASRLARNRAFTRWRPRVMGSFWVFAP